MKETVISLDVAPFVGLPQCVPAAQAQGPGHEPPLAADSLEFSNLIGIKSLVREECRSSRDPPVWDHGCNGTPWKGRELAPYFGGISLSSRVVCAVNYFLWALSLPHACLPCTPISSLLVHAPPKMFSWFTTPAASRVYFPQSAERRAAFGAPLFLYRCIDIMVETAVFLTQPLCANMKCLRAPTASQCWIMPSRSRLGQFLTSNGNFCSVRGRADSLLTLLWYTPYTVQRAHISSGEATDAGSPQAFH